MKPARDIPDIVRERQARASDPQRSAFVAANAGSGKTHVLVQRVIRLLLGGTDPARILCLTFTKAAAANMATRVFDTLRRWTALDDTQLRAAMQETGAPAASDVDVAVARRLFAQAVETPGGLKVQTIHAFCTRLLQQFPVEADVPARFTVLDDRMQKEILDHAALSVLLQAADAPDSGLGAAFRTAMSAVADSTLLEVVNAAIARRDGLQRWIEREGGLQQALAGLARRLGLREGDSADAIEREIVEGPYLPAAQWAEAARIFTSGKTADNRQAERLRAAMSLSGAQKVECYLSVFYTGKGEARAAPATKGLAAANPAFAARLSQEAKRLEGLCERRRAAAAQARTAALLTIVLAALERYRHEKERRGLLDYDDLIDKTLRMLSKVSPSWVHYKLDRGIDHVLIDEAQDTSPRQWEIVEKLVSEFSAGKGARNVRRTVFAVGDEKQSIFSFQGAAPREFDRMRRHFEAAFDRPELGWSYIEFQHSFRSGVNVLGAVDAVFAARDVYLSVTADEGGIPPHMALRDTAPGEVELWNLIEPEETHEIEGWDAPFDALAQTSPQVALARRIARRIGRMLQQGRKAGDILVLVRQRGILFESIIRALKNAHLPVAGADRLNLTQHIAIEDLMALGDALLLDSDDLALAVSLKSPLFGFDDEALFRLAHDRDGTLRAALRAKEPATGATIDRLAQEAVRMTPFSFYANLLNREGGRRRILARLGMEAADALDEFLNLALVYEARETPSLQGFLAWLRAAETEIKRDMDIARDEIRVMTVHGAKGLEAPVVFLADTTTKPEGRHAPRLISLADGEEERGAQPFVWASAGRNDTAVLAAAREDHRRAERDEYRRLLYVAMTRAAQTLIVCGCTGKQRRSEGCWYDLVRDALGAALVEVETPDGPVFYFWKSRPAERPAATPETAALPAQAALPNWILRDAPQQALPVRAVAPSGWHDDDVAIPAADGRRARALARGTLVHRLLQSLPDIPRERRADAARRHLARAGPDFDTLEHEEIVAQVLAILDNPRFAELFADTSRAEVSVVGRTPAADGTSVAVAGQIDRLAVTAQRVLIADYKTNRPAPARLEDVPRAYIRQLAHYRALLAAICPGRDIRAALIWTETAELMEIPSQMLDAAYSETATLTSA